MNTPCEDCPIKNLADVVIFLEEGIRSAARGIIEHSTSPDEEESTTILTLIMGCIDRGIPLNASKKIYCGIKKCLDTHPGDGVCERHYLLDCIRKWRVEQTLKFYKENWEESGKDEEKFLALMDEREVIHFMAMS